MLDLARFESHSRLRGTLVLAAGIGALALFFISFYPSLAQVDIDAYLEAFPPAMREAFGLETIATIEGFLAAEMYHFIWLLLLGLYFGYSAAGLVARDVEQHKTDLLLTLPISRDQFLIQKYGSLLVPIILLNLLIPVITYGGVLLIGETIAPTRLAMVHLLSIPFLLACAAIGLLISTFCSRADTANRLALGILFGLFIIDSVTATTQDLAWIRYLTPTAYYDPTSILVHGSYNFGNAAMLLLMTGGFLMAAGYIFNRRDIQA